MNSLLLQNNTSMSEIEKNIIKEIQTIDPENPAQYVLELIKPLSLEKINQKVIQCNLCGLCNKMLPSGDIRSPILVIGEYPKPNIQPYEDILNEYFIDALESMNIKYDRLYYCNCIQCLPMNKKLPSKAELSACYDNHISNLIFSLQPKCILLLGNVASRMFLGGTLQSVRGEWNYISNIPTIATYHPDYFVKMKNIKNQDILNEEYNYFINDLNIVFEYIRSLGYILK